jgi:hypothetical protein
VLTTKNAPAEDAGLARSTSEIIINPGIDTYQFSMTCMLNCSIESSSADCGGEGRHAYQKSLDSSSARLRREHRDLGAKFQNRDF